ncbi:MAG: glutamate synthase subunit beta [Betaproteobacteria bacterium AqS2]|uniref:Glutamate synthase subunit beta n=1 Tax=Candidatus Amphirhobacter heronislandensis TaxID=1732024 RepID=A0A930XWE5_9GAMM|nr:glutamate synthase subunit beta [Betaproteobacteria bacterium AqS2]
MGKATGFLEIERAAAAQEEPGKRLRGYREFVLAPADAALREQGARCMDCGIPYCQEGCPVSNVIPDWNDLVYRDDWHEAYRALAATNNFPEFTGRICPAPCEASCTLNFNDEPVTIKSIELAVIERAFKEGWARPQPAARPSGKSVAVVGSGPAGLACAQQLARAGHKVTVYEKNDRIGGLLRYGIPDFKMEKRWIDRRLEQMEAEGVEFRPNSHVGEELPVAELRQRHDAVALCGGCEHPRDLEVEGRGLQGTYFAMEFLPLQNRRVAGDSDVPELTAAGKHVIVIGGGDTGSDCIGTSNRHGAKSITQFELLPKPPDAEDKMMTWPDWPLKLRTSSSHEEGCDRDWSIATTRLEGDDDGRLKALYAQRVEWRKGDDGRMRMEKTGDEIRFEADLVLLAMGYVHPRHDGPVAELGLALDGRGNVQATTDDFRTSADGVYAAGDMRRGQSLVVWAIREGRMCARAIDLDLMGATALPR